MRIIHVCEYASGGIATYIKTLVKHQVLNKNIDEIIIFVSATNSEDFEFDSNKVRVIRYSYRRSFMGLLKLLKLWGNIKELKPDVVHLHSTFAGLLRARSMFQPHTFRIIYCSHGWAFARKTTELKKKIIATVERILSKGCDWIINISPSEQLEATKRKIPKNKMSVINNAIDFTEIGEDRSPTDGPLAIAFIGRFDRQKGVDILIEAAKSLQQCHFKLAGQGILQHGSQEEIQLPSNIELLGWLSSAEVNQLMLESDAVIVPSRWEGFGLVALEAMKNGCAVLASNVGGLADIVKPNENGLLFNPSDPQAIVSALNSVDRQQLHKFGKNGRSFAMKNFNASRMEQKVFQTYCAH